MSGGQYHFFGFKRTLTKLLTAHPLLPSIRLVMNIDGLPISKSGSLSTSLWPILCKVYDAPEFGVFPVAMCLTSAKPSDLAFLNQTLEEIQNMIAHGFAYSSRVVPVELFQVVCDAPARAMCKGIKSFSGYFGCDGCQIRGVYSHKFMKITYPQIRNLILRTDESFRAKTMMNITQDPHPS